MASLTISFTIRISGRRCSIGCSASWNQSPSASAKSSTNGIHMQHHKGNADRPDEHGETVDWISIYKHGHEGEAEHPLKYTFLSFFREDPKTVFNELKRKNPREAFRGIFELASFVTTVV